MFLTACGSLYLPLLVSPSYERWETRGSEILPEFLASKRPAVISMLQLSAFLRDGPESASVAPPEPVPFVGLACQHLHMEPTKLIVISNRETENRAIRAVIAHERAAGRTAVDTRGNSSSRVDIESTDANDEKRLIEIKALGGSGRGDDLWLEPNQVAALEEVPGSHLYVVTNVRSADPSAIRILDLTGDRLRERLRVKREKLHYEVPLPVKVYDQLEREASAGSTTEPAGS